MKRETWYILGAVALGAGAYYWFKLRTPPAPAWVPAQLPPAGPYSDYRPYQFSVPITAWDLTHGTTHSFNPGDQVTVSASENASLKPSSGTIFYGDVGGTASRLYSTMTF